MDESRYEPGPSGNYGADGIPREGMEERYATALWRDDPSAFWLHPEGPLSDTTPEEYFVPRPPVDPVSSGYAARGLLQSAYANSLGNQLSQAQIYHAQMQLQQSAYARNSQLIGNFGGLLPRFLGGV